MCPSRVRYLLWPHMDEKKDKCSYYHSFDINARSPLLFIVEAAMVLLRECCYAVCTVSFSGIDELGSRLGHHQLEGHQGRRNILKLISAAQSTFNSPSVLSTASLTLLKGIKEKCSSHCSKCLIKRVTIKSLTCWWIILQPCN